MIIEAQKNGITERIKTDIKEQVFCRRTRSVKVYWNYFLFILSIILYNIRYNSLASSADNGSCSDNSSGTLQAWSFSFFPLSVNVITIFLSSDSDRLRSKNPRCWSRFKSGVKVLDCNWSFSAIVLKFTSFFSPVQMFLNHQIEYQSKSKPAAGGFFLKILTQKHYENTHFQRGIDFKISIFSHFPRFFLNLPFWPSHSSPPRFFFNLPARPSHRYPPAKLPFNFLCPNRLNSPSLMLILLQKRPNAFTNPFRDVDHSMTTIQLHL